MKRQRDDHALATLMQAAQGGDTQAYVLWLKEITPRLRQIVRAQHRFLKIDDIEDLVQDILLSLHAVRSTYDPKRPFMPWLLAITRNRLADGVRRYARREALEVLVDDWTVTFSDSAANSTSTGHIHLDELRHAIQALPAGQRTAIEILKLREMSLKDAAAACGMSIGALKVATHRAMNTLRKRLRDNEFEE